MSIVKHWEGLKSAWQRRTLYKALTNAIAAHDADAVNAALDNGADPNYTPSHFSFTPMGRAITEGTPEIFDLLQARGGDITQSVKKDQRIDIGTFRYSLLHLAIESGQENIALKLAGHEKVDFEDGGTYPSYKTGSLLNHPYPSPLEMARGKGMENVVAVLADRTADKLQKAVYRLKQESGGIRRAKPVTP